MNCDLARTGINVINSNIKSAVIQGGEGIKIFIFFLTFLTLENIKVRRWLKTDKNKEGGAKKS